MSAFYSFLITNTIVSSVQADSFHRSLGVFNNNKKLFTFLAISIWYLHQQQNSFPFLPPHVYSLYN